MDTAILCAANIPASLLVLDDGCRTLRTHYCARTLDEGALWALNAKHIPWVSGLSVRPAPEPGRVLVMPTSYDVPLGGAVLVSVSAATRALAELHQEVG
jgi:hypothetical protein